jgi:tetratricopeptide (TPR) repeat protein
MTRQLFIIFSLFFLFSCKQTQDCLEVNSLPMFGGLKKCDEQIKADRIFLADCDKFYKNRNEATLHHIDMGWGYFYKNELDSSMMRFNQAWLLDSTNANIYWGFGNILGRKQQFKKSIPFLAKSIEINPNNPKVYECISTSYGQIFFETKDIKYLNLTIENLKHSVRLNPNNASAYGQLTGAYSYFNQTDSARKYLEITDRLDPKAVNPEVRNLLSKK